VQVGRGVRLFQGEPMAQHFPQQRVDAEPVVPPGQADNQGVPRGEAFQDQLAVPAAGQLVRKGRGDPVRHAGAEQELPVRRGQPVDHLFDEVLGDQGDIAGET